MHHYYKDIFSISCMLFTTSSWRLFPSKLKGFKTIVTVNPFADLMVLRISTAAE